VEEAGLHDERLGHGTRFAVEHVELLELVPALVHQQQNPVAGGQEEPRRGLGQVRELDEVALPHPLPVELHRSAEVGIDEHGRAVRGQVGRDRRAHLEQVAEGRHRREPTRTDVAVRSRRAAGRT
jgi:hypothetical protein